MFTLEYSGRVAAVIINENYIYRFSSKEDAKRKIDSAEKIYVIYSNHDKEVEKSPSVLQQLKIKFDGYTYDEL